MYKISLKTTVYIGSMLYNERTNSFNPYLLCFSIPFLINPDWPCNFYDCMYFKPPPFQIKMLEGFLYIHVTIIYIVIKQKRTHIYAHIYMVFSGLLIIQYA